MEKADSAQKLYNKIRLWEFPDQYVVEPTDGSSASSLAISRLDGSMNLLDEIPHCDSLRVPKIRTIFGVVGMLKLLAGSYLIVITDRECVGSYSGYPIYKITSLKVFPCDHSLKNSPEEQLFSNGKYKSILHRVVVNNQKTRISIAMTNGPSLDTVLRPASKLVQSEESAPAYTPMKYREYILSQQSNQLSSKDMLKKVKPEEL